MEARECRRLPEKDEITVTLECLDCDEGVVKCARCGQPEWWTDATRGTALNAAEAHRWETGHARVVMRGFDGKYAGQVIMEVGDQ
jgi:hypothetical protein